MNCSSFKRQTADWLDRRLSLDHSREMASHRDGCATCSQAALVESQMRREWHEESSAMPIVDLWPRLLTRLEAQAPSPAGAYRQKVSRLPQWAVGGAFFLTAMGVIGFHPLRQKIMDEHHSSSVSINAATPNTREAKMTQGNTIPWMGLGDVSQVDPIVNDPLGENMETVWTNIKTTGK